MRFWSCVNSRGTRLAHNFSYPVSRLNLICPLRWRPHSFRNFSHFELAILQDHFVQFYNNFWISDTSWPTTPLRMLTRHVFTAKGWFIITREPGCGSGDPGGDSEKFSKTISKSEIDVLIFKKSSSSSSFRVFCPRAGLSLQTQEPRLQFCPKAGLSQRSQEPRLQFY